MAETKRLSKAKRPPLIQSEPIDRVPASIDVSGNCLHPHPFREAIQQEVLAWPYPVLRAPLQMSHIAVHTGGPGTQDERSHLVNLCRRLGAAGPRPGANFFTFDFGDFELRWERHAEFYTYTITSREPFSRPFRGVPLSRLPIDWLAGLDGRIINAVHIAIEASETAERSRDDIQDIFEGHRLIGSRVVDGGAAIWSAFRSHADMFGRIYVRNQTLTEPQMGRLIQRILEIEDFRMLAMLSFPVARDMRQQLTEAEAILRSVTESLSGAEPGARVQTLLIRLGQLSLDADRLRAEIVSSFTASKGYYHSVQQSIEELREREIPGFQTFAEFLERRLMPSMDECEAVLERTNELCSRIQRAIAIVQARTTATLQDHSLRQAEALEVRSDAQVRVRTLAEVATITLITIAVTALSAFIVSTPETGALYEHRAVVELVVAPASAVLSWFVLNKRGELARTSSAVRKS